MPRSKKGLTLLLPYHRAVFVTARPAAEVFDRLRERTAQLRWFGTPDPTKPFRGSVHSRSFRIAANEPGLNTYAPYIRGSVAAHTRGSSVNIVATLHPAACVILGVGIVASFFFARNWWPVVFWCAFHVAMCRAGFWPTIWKADAALQGMLG